MGPHHQTGQAALLNLALSTPHSVSWRRRELGKELVVDQAYTVKTSLQLWVLRLSGGKHVDVPGEGAHPKDGIKVLYLSPTSCLLHLNLQLVGQRHPGLSLTSKGSVGLDPAPSAG